MKTPSAPPASAQPTATQAPAGSVPPIYPQLRHGVTDEGIEEDIIASADNYRLQEASKLRKHLEDEKEARAGLYKKYRRGVNVLDGVDTALITAGMVLGIGGVSLLSTVIAAPVVLGLEVAALACSVAGISGKFISRRLAAKAMKHGRIKQLAESKLNTIADHVSAALVDGKISDEEFRLIISEIEKYNQMKASIRAAGRKAHAEVKLDEETKNSRIQRGRDEARASLIKKLAAP